MLILLPFEKSNGFNLGFLHSRGGLGFNPGLFQLHRSDLFLANRQEREMSHSVVTYFLANPII
jgi:hypothetical protein